MLSDIVEREVTEKQWDIKTALMSHTPMTKEAAQGLKRDVDETDKELKRILRSVRKSSFDRNAPLESQHEIRLEPGERMSDFQ